MTAKVDEFGAVCTDCYGPLYVDKIERGPKIGVRVTFKHVERKPSCGQSKIVVQQ